MMRNKLRKCTFGILVVAISLCDGTDAADKPAATRQLWMDSKVVGFPDPPPPLTVQRVYDQSDFKNPLSVTSLPGTRDLLVTVHHGGYGGPGRLLRMPSE